MKKVQLLLVGLFMTFLGELFSVAGIYLSSQLIMNNDPLAKLLSGVFIGLLLISFGTMTLKRSHRVFPYSWLAVAGENSRIASTSTAIRKIRDTNLTDVDETYSAVYMRSTVVKSTRTGMYLTTRFITLCVKAEMFKPNIVGSNLMNNWRNISCIK